ncbi:MAG: hypothetical protein P9M13_05165 [Candidatus Ancaeobacter aquaticus]|nr:hypothetical protein [Candidatus Ancaeobacter aquaticus]
MINKKTKNKHNGFSFIGIATFTVLVVVTIAIVFGLVATIARSGSHAIIRAQATSLAQAEIEFVVAQPFDKIVQEPARDVRLSDGTMSVSKKVSYVNGPQDLTRPVKEKTMYKKVTVTVSHKKIRSVVFETVRAKRK